MSVSHYAGIGDLVTTRRYFEEALEFSRRVEGDDAPSTVIALLNIGALLTNEGFMMTLGRISRKPGR